MNNFENKVIEELRKRYPHEDIESSSKIKSNDVVLHGITIGKNNSSVSLQIFLDSYYEQYINGMSMDVVIQKIVEDYEKHGHIQFILPNLQNFSTIKSNIRIKLINTKMSTEYLEDLVHTNFLDLSATFYIRLYDTASTMVTNRLFELWGITFNELLETAIENMINSFSIRNMGDALKEFGIMGDIEDGRISDDLYESVPMYLICNNEKLYGACYMMIPDIMRRVSDLLKEDFYILPSSLHEIIILPKSEVLSTDETKEMIEYVNDTQVSIEERLSYNLYEYKREIRKVTIVE